MSGRGFVVLIAGGPLRTRGVQPSEGALAPCPFIPPAHSMAHTDPHTYTRACMYRSSTTHLSNPASTCSVSRSSTAPSCSPLLQSPSPPPGGGGCGGGGILAALPPPDGPNQGGCGCWLTPLLGIVAIRQKDASLCAAVRVRLDRSEERWEWWMKMVSY